ncbi:hypothetical protein OpiT1DRAFT_04188 [Opitutaceae bacterium TAV1]|nr:hypothetical protein OpiT1DRAFT_04188 [Opitutaceae bacterium TAV1]
MHGWKASHRDKTNVLFTDGHVKSLSQQDLVSNWPIYYTNSVTN